MKNTMADQDLSNQVLRIKLGAGAGGVAGKKGYGFGSWSQRTGSC